MKYIIYPLLAAIASSEVFFQETFSDDGWRERWVDSAWKSDLGKFERNNKHHLLVDEDIEMGLQTPSDAKFYAISSKLNKPFTNKDQDLVVQFSVKNPDQDDGFCGGGYIKLLPASLDQEQFGGDSDYYIMFGPDICGYETSRIHVIFNYGDDNLLRDEDIKLEYDEKNSLTHVYTLVVRPDNSYTVYLDDKEKAHGFLHDDWAFPPKQIPDPLDIKPDNWVDDEMIVDPNDEKPEEWDSIPKMISDAEAKQPSDWDEEDDGEWEAPMIHNPEWKGEWTAKQIKNPDYKGPWIQKLVDNPNYEKDVYVYDNIGAVGFELWVVNSGAIFDNIYIGNSLEEAKKFSTETYGKIHSKEEEAEKKYKDNKNKEATKNFEESKSEEDDEVDLDEIEPREEL